MGLQDFEVFIKERLSVWDQNLDTSSGSPIDSQVIQPLLRRIGTDPFTLDASSFIVTRLTQEFPDLAFTDGDAVSDLLAKPALLLWDPIIREIQRVKNSQSFKDAATLTNDEAEALGANLFQTRDAGASARGVARMYFTQPQPINVTSTNFFTSKTGLHFFPTGSQGIKSNEMVLNLEGDLYYFDVNVIAEAAGDAYNIGPTELTSVANIAAAVRVTNKLRFRAGLPEEDATTFVGRVQQSLTEHSLVTSRGIAARLTGSFPDITRLNIVGFNDPEMQRDVITGGALGPMLAFGADAIAMPDGTFRKGTRRLRMPSANFFALIGPAGTVVNNCVVTLFDMFLDLPSVRDMPVARVIDQHTIEVVDQVLKPGAAAKAWALRKFELTLSGIPGGIIFPDSPTGTVKVTSDEVHIGGATDMLVRGISLDTASLFVDIAYDDTPLYSGTKAEIAVVFGTTIVGLTDYTLGTNFNAYDQTGKDFADAAKYGWSLEILTGPAAGVYRVMTYLTASPGDVVVYTLQPTPPVAPGLFEWRLSYEVHIDLVEPKQTRVSGSTGKSTQHLTTFSSSPSIDFAALGVSVGDTLRILNGPDAGDFQVKSLASPFFTQITMDRAFTSTSSGLSFTVFRPNAAGGVQRPLLRVTSIDLLNTSGQPVGSKVPYAKPVEALSRSFQNAGNGVKVEVRDAQVGLLSDADPGGYTFFGGGTLQLTYDGAGSPFVVTLVGTQAAFEVVNNINIASNASPSLGFDIAVLVSYGGSDYVGIIPFAPNVTTSGTDTITQAALFGGSLFTRSTRDIRSASVSSWADIRPTIDPQLDSTWVVDGQQNGFYTDQKPGVGTVGNPSVDTLLVSYDFSPELALIVRVGARSVGSARVYFLDPTSAEVDQTAVFATTAPDGTILNFRPDPTLTRQLVPALPNGTKPLDGSLAGTTFTSASSDFLKKGVRVGDKLVIDFVPITGSVTIHDPVLGLALKQLRISLDNQPDRFITFVNDVGTLGAVSRKGVVDQINSAVGFVICSMVEIAPGNFHLRFNPKMPLTIRQQSGATLTAANVMLGFNNITDTNNRSAHFGSYDITAVAPGGAVTQLTIGPALSAEANEQFTITRVGEQRIVSTTMQNQTALGGLYYWDVELMSEGPGDLWNIDADQTMVLAGYRSDGFYLLTKNTHLTFSPAEDIELVMSRSILEAGVDDDPANATNLAGQKLSISYEYSSLVQSLQSFISSESERVINDSPLGRHLIPHYVRFDLTYSGGSLASDIMPSLESYIQAVPPDVAMESSDVQKIVSDKGAVYIANPLELMAVVYDFDRSVYMVRSSDSLTTGRLAAFIPDAITLTRKTS
jgi:hypothetical protein